jgi:nucleoside-diphosphate-sugar epimerase
VASDLSYNPDPNKVIPVVERGVLNTLKAAAKTPSIKRFILTSSSLSAMHPAPNVRFEVTEDSWNEIDVKLAWEPPPYDFSRVGAVYSASKTRGEQVAWEFVKEKRPSFTFNAVLPSFNMGPILSDKQSGSSAGLVNGLHAGDVMATQLVRDVTPPTYMVNVEDSARLHVLALLEEDVRDERLFAFSEPINYSTIVQALKKVDPTKADYPAPPENEGRDLSTIPTARAEELLRRSGRAGFVGLEESLKAQFAPSA